MQSNVILELQGRQWRQVEGWSVKKLSQFAEERALLGLRKSVSPIFVLEWQDMKAKPRSFSGAVGV